MILSDNVQRNLVILANTLWPIKLIGILIMANNPLGGVLPYKKLMRMCHWTGSHLHNWIDYHEVAFSIEILEWGCTFSDVWGKTVFHCAVPENIHTPPTEGIGISWGGGGFYKAKKFKEMYEA